MTVVAITTSEFLFRMFEILVIAGLGILIFQSGRHKQADEAMGRTINAQRDEIESLRRRLANHKDNP